MRRIYVYMYLSGRASSAAQHRPVVPPRATRRRGGQAVPGPVQHCRLHDRQAGGGGLPGGLQRRWRGVPGEVKSEREKCVLRICCLLSNFSGRRSNVIGMCGRSHHRPGSFRRKEGRKVAQDFSFISLGRFIGHPFLLNFHHVSVATRPSSGVFSVWYVPGISQHHPRFKKYILRI